MTLGVVIICYVATNHGRRELIQTGFHDFLGPLLLLDSFVVSACVLSAFGLDDPFCRLAWTL